MNSEQSKNPHIILRYTLLACGHIVLVIGVVGIFVPLLPTTPFLLLAAWFYSRGSKTFESWLLNHKYLGPPVVAWRTHRVVRPGAKILAGLVITSSVIYVWWNDQIPMFGRVGMTLVVIPVLLYVLTRKNSAS